jgi:IS605 OrfB family transposase
MGCLVKQIINYAVQQNKGIVFEDLDFSDNEYKHLETKWNRVKSNFTWRTFLNLLAAKCIQYGIQYKAVKPAFTSIIGKYKYQKLYKIPVHQAAAYVIGRRGLGYKERLSIYGYSRRKVRNFILRTLAGKYGRKKLFNWSLWAAVNRYPDVILPGLLGDIDDLEELSDDILRQGSILVHERDPHEHNLSTITGRRELSSLSKTKTRYKGKKDPCHKTGHY